ncbi:MAG: septal ring lytic transglycosylase RlpA family protein [Treponema sp.]|nr:septal ring lytic transglycosylase RlpA family protein [Treponema sp.]
MKRLGPVLVFFLVFPVFVFSQTQTGNASYNPGKEGFTISHSSLSFNTRVKVTNLQNNRFEEAVVNARIPISADRIADISRELGNALEMPRNGLTLVELEILPSRPRVSAPVSDPVPDPVPVSDPVPAPVPISDPVPDPDPVPAPVPVSDPVPVPIPAPVPVAAAVPAPDPIPAPVPVSAVVPVPAVVPVSRPVPAPAPVPQEKEPEPPAPVPVPVPEIRTEIQYIPVPSPCPEKPCCLPFLIPILGLLLLIIILIVIVMLLVSRKPVFWPWYRPVRIRRRYRCGRWGRNFY